MRIMQDYQTFIRQKYGGIARYHYELNKNLNLQGNHSDIYVMLSQCEYLKNEKKTINYRNKAIRNVMLIANDIRTFIHLAINRLKKNKYDIVHVTWYKSFYLPIIAKKKNRPAIIMTVYDLIHEMVQDRDPVMAKGVTDRKRTMSIVDGIICISENTKRDLLKYYPKLKKVPIKVIYLGASLVESSLPRIIDENYILFVGNRKDYKNFANFAMAVAPILKKDNKLFVFCAGGGAFDMDEIKLLKQQGVYKQFIQKSVSEEELASLYKNAECFVFPSLYEGFGIPILEAFGYGCPIAIHNGSCFPEIASDAAEYFDGNSVDEIRHSIEKILYNEGFAKNLVEKGKKRFELFSWEKTAEETSEFYRSIIKSQRIHRKMED